MNEVQLDKNSYARRLRDECNQEATIKCCAPPHHLLDAADEDVIAFAKQQGRLLLTFDRAIAFDQPYALGATFPGILILALEDDSVKRMGVPRRILMGDDLWVARLPYPLRPLGNKCRGLQRAF